jgi:S-methylmethionine-dependent homocysteine/selenocysteine methylase
VGDLTILDGGMGGELQRRGLGKSGGLWSAQALIEHPDLVADIHRDYIDAGARVIITNSYSTIPSYLGKEGMEDRCVELTQIAGRIARDAADAAPETVLVAGSLPPLDESYRFDLAPPDEDAVPVYRALAEALLPYVDLFICETMSCAREARNAAAAARSVGGDTKPVWVSWTLAEVPGGGLRSGESIEVAYDAVAEFAPDAFLFNCTDPNAISAGLRELSQLTDKPIGAYPNRFHVPEGWTLDNEIKTETIEMSIEDYVGFAETWRESGATVIGGCCGVGPEFIRALAASAQ